MKIICIKRWSPAPVRTCHQHQNAVFRDGSLRQSRPCGEQWRKQSRDEEHVKTSRCVQNLLACNEQCRHASSKLFHFYWHVHLPAAWTSSQLKLFSLSVSLSRSFLFRSSSLPHVRVFSACMDSSHSLSLSPSLSVFFKVLNPGAQLSQWSQKSIVHTYFAATKKRNERKERKSSCHSVTEGAVHHR